MWVIIFFSQPGKQTAQFVLSWSFVITLSIYSLFPLKVPQKSSQTRNKTCSLPGPLSSAPGRGPNSRCCVETWLVYWRGNRSGDILESWATCLAPGVQVALEGRQMRVILLLLWFTRWKVTMMQRPWSLSCGVCGGRWSTEAERGNIVYTSQAPCSWAGGELGVSNLNLWKQDRSAGGW